MWIGKWNKSVILTYIGLAMGVIGTYLIMATNIGMNKVFVCFILAGVCDLFDGFVARKCKRTDEEKEFGIQLDSLVDVANFVIFPIVLMLGLGLKEWYHLIVYVIYAICGVARLAYFNILAEENNGEPLKYYTGLPVTSSVLVFGLGYHLHYLMSECVFGWFFILSMLLVAILFISKIKIKKPRGKAYIFLSLLALINLVVYILV